MSDYNLKQLRGAFGAGVAAAEKAADSAERGSRIVGRHFHSFNEPGIPKWQGRVLGEPKPGVFLIQLYSWIDGYETDKKLIPFSDMMDWAFYDSDREMVATYNRKYADAVKAWCVAKFEAPPIAMGESPSSGQHDAGKGLDHGKNDA